MFIALGVAGIVLFYGPMNSLGDSCYCLIPSPEPGAAQGTSSIILALGVLFFPMGLMKGGLPTLRRGPARGPQGPVVGQRVTPPAVISSGAIFTLGILAVVLGVDAVLVPGYLVLKSFPVIAAGAAIAALGVVAVYLGSRKPKAS